MASTTLKSIRESLESTIAGTDPTGKVFGRGKFQRAPTKYEWRDMPEQHIDRSFTVDFINEGPATMFGDSSEYDYEGDFTVTVGHKKTNNRQDSLDRMNTDVSQIREVLEDKGNYPTSVWLIRFEGVRTRDLGKHWVSVLSFRGVWTRAAP